ncbi:hypothetical protein CR513_30839, partial [Mucuna pruriens]
MIDVKIRTDEIHVLDVTKLRKLILQKGRSSDSSAQLRAIGTYQNLKKMFRWLSLKEKVTKPMYCGYFQEIKIREPKALETRVYLEILGELPRALETMVKIDYKL